MKHNISLKNTIAFIKTRGIDLGKTQAEQLELYHGLLKKWNRKHNLVSGNDERFLIERHFLPSFLYVYFLKKDGLFIDRQLADIGSGGGFPGIVVSICFPDNKIYLIESIRKKTLFLRFVVKSLGLKTEVINGRIEEQKTEKYDVVTARALAALNKLDKYAALLLKKGGRLYTLKGGDYMNEIRGRLKLQPEEKEIPSEWQSYSERISNKKMIVLKKF